MSCLYREEKGNKKKVEMIILAPQSSQKQRNRALSLSQKMCKDDG